MRKPAQIEKGLPAADQFVTVEGISLHYYSKGEGQPVVFLHGGILSGVDFENVIELASQQGYRAIAFDRPGYGYSERPKKKVTPQLQAQLIHEALRKLNADQPIIAAHSWSGTMALSYALQFPDDVKGIVALGAAMYKEGYPAENGDPISSLVTAPLIGPLILHALLKTPIGTAAANHMLNASFAPEPVPAGYREKVLALWLRPGQFRANREDVLAFPAAYLEASKRYSEIQTPLVIAVGEKDPFGTIEQARRLKQDVPHAELMIFPDTAHMIPQNHPEKVMEAVKRIDAAN